jgi:hypothetical protein
VSSNSFRVTNLLHSEGVTEQKGVTVVLQWCDSGVTVELQRCRSGVIVVYSGVTAVLQWGHSGVTCSIRKVLRNRKV